MAKTIRTKVFNFSELSSEAKEVAVNSNSEINFGFGDWWENVYYDAKEIGLKITSFDVDRHRHANGELLLSFCEVAQNILNNHGEHCSTYKTAEYYMKEWQPLFDGYMDETNEFYESLESGDKLMELEEDFLTSLLEDYSIILQKEMEYLYSDEAVIETIKANDYYFTQEGKVFNQ